jgi:hypothetical protein
MGAVAVEEEKEKGEEAAAVRGLVGWAKRGKEGRGKREEVGRGGRKEEGPGRAVACLRLGFSFFLFLSCSVFV